MKDTGIIIGMAVIAVVIGVVIFLNGGSTNNTQLSAEANNTSQTAAIVPFTKITSGQKSTVTTRVNYLITTSDELEKLWKMVDAKPPPPTVDFKTHAILAVFAGKASSIAIAVAKIEDTDARMVSITLAKPDANCITGQSLTAPYEIVAVPATSLPLTHEDISTTISCP